MSDDELDLVAEVYKELIDSDSDEDVDMSSNNIDNAAAACSSGSWKTTHETIHFDTSPIESNSVKCEVSIDEDNDIEQSSSRPYEINNPLCPKPGTLLAKYAYGSAVKIADGSTRTLYECRICKVKSNGIARSAMVVHIRHNHFGQEYKCKICGMAFPSSARVILHFNIVHADVIDTKQRNVGIYQCNQCSISCRYSSALRYHMCKVHQGFHYKCDKCNKSYKKVTGLRLHISKVHDRFQGKAQQCPRCTKAFTNIQGLRNHRRTMQCIRD